MPKHQFAPSRAKLFFAAAILVLALALGLTTYVTLGLRGTGSTGLALVGGPFSLTDHNGKRVTDKDFRGRYMLVFFGYTFCPDVCPTELQVMSAALASMGPKADKIQPLFITIDPERDTADVLRQYVTNFDPRLVGLTGSADDIAKVASAYRVYYGRAGGKTASTDYLMDHSSIIYLMDPQGTFLKHFSYTTDAPDLARGLTAAIAP